MSSSLPTGRLDSNPGEIRTGRGPFLDVCILAVIMANGRNLALTTLSDSSEIPHHNLTEVLPFAMGSLILLALLTNWCWKEENPEPIGSGFFTFKEDAMGKGKLESLGDVQLHTL